MPSLRRGDRVTVAAAAGRSLRQGRWARAIAATALWLLLFWLMRRAIGSGTFLRDVALPIFAVMLTIGLIAGFLADRRKRDGF